MGITTFIIATLFFSVSTSSVRAICSGFKLAIGNIISLNTTEYRWNVYDDSCNVVDGLTTNSNPCTQGIFGCSPSPILFVNYTSSVNGLRYACVKDPSSEDCDANAISVCCNQTVPPQSKNTITSGNIVATPHSSTNSQAPSTSSNLVNETSPSLSSLSGSGTSDSTVVLPSTATQTPSSISSDFAPSTSSQSSDPTLSSAPASETTASVTKGGVGAGTTAGIVVGVVLFLLIIALTALIYYKKRQNRPPPLTLPFLIKRSTDVPHICKR